MKEATLKRTHDALRREGLALELVRAVQGARKQAGLEVADRNFDFPAFNVVDSAITIGAALIVLDNLLKLDRARTKKKLTSS